MGGGRDEEGRPRERAHRAGEGAPLGARHESAESSTPARQPLVMLGLGDSVGTPAEGIEADVLVVRSFEELDARRATRGDASCSSTCRSPTTARRCGSAPAARRAPRALGAVAVLVRSVGPAGLRTPAHRRAALQRRTRRRFPPRRSRPRTRTGCSACRIAARRSVVRLEDGRAFRARRGVLQRRRRAPRPRAAGRGRRASAATSTRGTWAPASTDDGGGCVVTWEALRLMKKLNLRPRRTVRVVLWTNEENGGARRHSRTAISTALNSPNHVLMLESDGGVFRPSGFGFTGSDAGARTHQGDRDAAARHRGRSASAPPAAAPTSARACRRRTFRRCRSR